MPDDVVYPEQLSGITTLPCAFSVMGTGGRQIPIMLLDSNDPAQKARVDKWLERVAMTKTYAVMLVRPGLAKPKPVTTLRVDTSRPEGFTLQQSDQAGERSGGVVPGANIGGVTPRSTDEVSHAGMSMSARSRARADESPPVPPLIDDLDADIIGDGKGRL